MATYRYTTLTDDVQHNIKAAVYSKEELKDIYNGLEEKAQAGKKKMKIVLIILIVVYFLFILPAFMQVGDMGENSLLASVVSALAPLPFFAIGYALARWHSFGMFCHQWNKAIKKGYPQFVEDFKL